MTGVALVPALSRQIAQSLRGPARHWNRFWFTPADPAALAAIRILVGLVLLYVHLGALPILFAAVGPEGWIDAQAWRQVSPLGSAARWTLWSGVDSAAAIIALVALFLLATACLTVGLCSRPAAVIVWLGQLSYAQRAFPLTYGLDSVLAFLTLYLMLGPSGGAFSVDSWLASRRRPGRRPEPSVLANVAVRCIQVHMCIVYLFAGLSKLQGTQWWSGMATYYAAMNPEMWPLDFPVGWIGRYPGVVSTLANASVLFTLAFEISFVFLIWNKRLRPLLLALGVLLHGGIGLLMGLGAFGLAMLAGCTAFVSPTECRAAAGLVSRRWRVPGGLSGTASAARATQRRPDALSRQHRGAAGAGR